jgi:hypothetical protein
MRFLTASLLVLACASATLAIGIAPLSPSDPTILNSAARGLTVGPDGTVYVAGQVKVDATNFRAAYWTANGAVINAPVVLGGNAGGTTATLANGIGVLANGSVVVSGNLGGGASDWNSGLAANGGWNYRLNASNTQANTGGTANQLAVSTGTNNFYDVGKSPSTADTAYVYAVDGTTGTSTTGSTSLKVSGATSAGGTAMGVSATGVAVGEVRAGTGNIRRAYVYDYNTNTRTVLLGVPGRTDMRAQGTAISANGTVVGAYGRWTDSDTFDFPIYWTKDPDTGSWGEGKQLGRLDSYTSSSFVFGMDQTGQIIVGTEYPNATIGEASAFWDTSVFDDYGRPKVNLLKDYLAGKGVNMSNWISLGRTYSAFTVNGLTYITGDGKWNDGVTTGGVTRGFLAVIPEPASLGLLALGSLLLVRRRGV